MTMATPSTAITVASPRPHCHVKAPSLAWNLQGPPLPDTCSCFRILTLASPPQLFEHFTKMKDDAAKLKSTNMSAQVDAVINLWTNMTIAEAKHERKVADNVHRVQDETLKRVDELSKALEELSVRFKEPSSATVGVGLVMHQSQSEPPIPRAPGSLCSTSD